MSSDKKINQLNQNRFEDNPWIDISVPISSGIVTWPGDPNVEVKRCSSIDKGDMCNTTHLSCTVHTATHLDAPFHFIQSGETIDYMPLTQTIGLVKLIEVNSDYSVQLKDIDRSAIEKENIILFKTKNSDTNWVNKAFNKEYVYISTEVAHLLVSSGVKAVGVDYLSVGGFEKNIEEVHHILLQNGVWIIEGLNLSGLLEGTYEFICLPILIKDSDGAPARAIIRSINQ